MQQGGWVSTDIGDAGDPCSWRGRLPFRPALRVAMRNTSLGMHRETLEAAAGAESGNRHLARIRFPAC